MAPTDRYWGRTALYRLFDRSGALLYIGITNDPEVRWKQHAASSHWWPDATRSVVEWHEERTVAAAAEAAAIRAERPRHNQTHAVEHAKRRHGDRGSLVQTNGLRLSVESFSMTAARPNLPWVMRETGAARYELGELPITYITSGGAPVLAVLPVWAAEWVEQHADEVFASLRTDATD